jgi:ring-1,2-phenylacetyl-CoA epoxidase subunit PaaE
VTLTEPPLTEPIAPVRARRGRFHALRVTTVDRLADDAVAVTFDVPEELREAFAFAHGQHLTIRTTLGDGPELRRTYSICTPATGGPLRVAVKQLAGGAFSTWANTALRPGAVLEVMTPTGGFTSVLDPTAARTYCAIAAGSGITPVLSIAATVLEVEPDSRVVLVYGNRTSRSVMFLEELADLKDRYPTRFQLVNVLSREQQEAELLSGRIDAAKVAQLLQRLIPAQRVDDWFLCGPLDMVDGVREALAEAGIDPHRVHVELFHADGPAPVPRPIEPADGAAAGSVAVTVQLDGRSSSYALPATGATVLDGLVGVRADAPYACKGGVCGTCRARLVSGEVAMDHAYALEQAEIDAGYVLTCQAHPAAGPGTSVVLDFDS